MQQVFAVWTLSKVTVPQCSFVLGALRFLVELAFLVVLLTLANTKKRFTKKLLVPARKHSCASRSHIFISSVPRAGCSVLTAPKIAAIATTMDIAASPPSQARPAELDTLLSSPDQYTPEAIAPLEAYVAQQV